MPLSSASWKSEFTKGANNIVRHRGRSAKLHEMSFRLYSQTDNKTWHYFHQEGARVPSPPLPLCYFIARDIITDSNFNWILKKYSMHEDSKSVELSFLLRMNRYQKNVGRWKNNISLVGLRFMNLWWQNLFRWYFPSRSWQMFRKDVTEYTNCFLS